MTQAIAIALPTYLRLTGDTENAWEMFRQRLELYLLSTDSTDKSDEEKVALLLVVGGEELIELIQLSY